MRHALTLPTGGPCADPRFLVDLAERAEAAGWDGVFLEDYVLFQGDPGAPTCDSWIALAGMAGRTSRVLLGTKVTPLSRRRPWVADGAWIVPICTWPLTRGVAARYSRVQAPRLRCRSPGDKRDFGAALFPPTASAGQPGKHTPVGGDRHRGRHQGDAVLAGEVAAAPNVDGDESSPGCPDVRLERLAVRAERVPEAGASAARIGQKPVAIATSEPRPTTVWLKRGARLSMTSRSRYGCAE
jgi:hypothetical protein